MPNRETKPKRVAKAPERKAQARVAPPDGLPIEDPLSTLPPTAQTLLSGARSIVAREGLRRLTIDAIVEETGANRAAIRYYFGSKAGLVAALVDSLVHDIQASVMRQTTGVPEGRERIRFCMLGAKTIVEDIDAYGVFFSILPETMRDEDLRTRLAKVYALFRKEDARWLIGNGHLSDRDFDALGTLMVALIDGMGIQRFLEADRDQLSLDRAFELFAHALEHMLIGLDSTPAE